ncbi:MAG: hypothetical protein WKF71_12525 [Pyrinomonadaceae bacterium]
MNRQHQTVPLLVRQAKIRQKNPATRHTPKSFGIVAEQNRTRIAGAANLPVFHRKQMLMFGREFETAQIATLDDFALADEIFQCRK